MLAQKVTFVIGVILCITVGCTFAIKQHHEMKKRSVVGASVTVPEQKESWTPATGPREFSVDVDDHIHGALQHRHEKWNNGTVTGTYAAPGRNGKWLKYDYIGDANGFRITSTKEVTPKELMDGHTPAQDHQANVNIKSDQNAAVQYTVTEEQLNKAKDKEISNKQ